MEKELKQDPINLVKVVLFGPESTGKTTLSKQLARHYNTVWTPEFAREYLQKKWNNERKTCEGFRLSSHSNWTNAFGKQVGQKSRQTCLFAILIC